MNYEHNFHSKNVWNNQNTHHQQNNNYVNTANSQYSVTQNHFNNKQNSPQLLSHYTPHSIVSTPLSNTVSVRGPIVPGNVNPSSIETLSAYQGNAVQAPLHRNVLPNPRIPDQNIYRGGFSQFNPTNTNAFNHDHQTTVGNSPTLSNVSLRPVSVRFPNTNLPFHAQSGIHSRQSQTQNINQSNQLLAYRQSQPQGLHSHTMKSTPMPHINTNSNIRPASYMNQASITPPVSHLSQSCQAQINTATFMPAQLTVKPLDSRNIFNTPPPPINKPVSVVANTYGSNFIRQPSSSTDIFPQTTVNKNLPYNVLPPVMPPIFPMPFPAMQLNHPIVSHGVNIEIAKPVCERENKVEKFIDKLKSKKKSSVKSEVSIQQFRYTLKVGLSMMKELQNSKETLKTLLDSNENDWAAEMKKVFLYKDNLLQICDFLTSTKNLECVQQKLKRIKKKKNLKKKLKEKLLKDKLEMQKHREELNQEVEKWLESIKEKNLKLKREAEMKKEADIILAEVRRKIQEAKKTIEKLKIFEKLRNTRQANAIQKGLFVPDYDENFKKKMENLKKTIHIQLSHYEAEERALKVMLEAEQEGQLEEEALWKVKRMKELQQKKQKNIMESLFGNSDDPVEEDPIFLFNQFHSSGNKSIDNLMQIRNQWDLHLNKDGEQIPHQWVVSVPPSSLVWESVLKS